MNIPHRCHNEADHSVDDRVLIKGITFHLWLIATRRKRHKATIRLYDKQTLPFMSIYQNQRLKLQVTAWKSLQISRENLKMESKLAPDHRVDLEIIDTKLH